MAADRGIAQSMIRVLAAQSAELPDTSVMKKQTWTSVHVNCEGILNTMNPDCYDCPAGSDYEPRDCRFWSDANVR